ncbi:MAG: hemerythrin family protein [Magnetococcales bacterium]|nr:hemerythrin family protein [Magnetococcales bacterium]
MSNLFVADVGVERFNKDHQRLLFYVQEFNRLSDRFAEREAEEDEWDQLDSIFKRFDKYTQIHFKAEEELMRAYDYPQLEEHLKQHADLIDTLHRLREQIESRQAGRFTEVKAFLAKWLLEHINDHDVRYSAFFQEKGVD